jgi:RNA 2',3'-cyclic 3'-phosphodiesterase
MRLFLSIEFSDEVLDHLEVLISSFSRLNRRVRCRWTFRENLHITVIFIGEVDEQNIKEIDTIIHEVVESYEPFNLELSKPIFLPHVKQPRIIALEWFDQAGVLKSMNKKLSNQLSRYLTKKAPDIFKAHVTLGRLKESRKIIIPDDLKRLQGAIFLVNGLYLRESTLTSMGSLYKTLYTYNLSDE